MNMKIVALTLPALLLAACEDRPRLTLNPGFGNAVQHNVAMQVVDPTPDPPVGPTAMDGRRATDAHNRYREGKVIPPRSLATSDMGGKQRK